MRKPPRLYFSLRSPFSWMAVRRLEERMPHAPEFIEYVPFSEPDPVSAKALQALGGTFHYTAMSKAKHFYILHDTKRLAAAFGYPLKWPIDTGDEWWDLPHLAWYKAKELGVQREFYSAVTTARWERGENLCDRETLERICDDAALDGAALVAAPDEPHIRRQGVQALMQIYEDDIFGVPYFRFGRDRFWGLDRLDDFLQAMSRGQGAETAVDLEGIPQPVIDRIGTADQDTAGGCG